MWRQISGREESTEWGTLSLGIDDDCVNGVASAKNNNIEPDNDHNNDSPMAMWRPLDGGKHSSDWGTLSLGGLVDH